MKPSRKAFTLVEIMIVVVIIGLLAAMAIPAFDRVKRNASFTRFLNDARILKDALQHYYLEVGVLPTDSNSGILAPELEDYIDRKLFEGPTPIGGKWDIEADNGVVVLAIGAVGYTVSNDDIAAFDAKYDDGNTATGNFRMIAAGRYYWVIE